MEKCNILFDERIIEFEKKDRWDHAVDYAYHQWKRNPFDVNRLLCVGTETWYALYLMEIFTDDPNPGNEPIFMQLEQMYAILDEVLKFGDMHYSNSSSYNAYMGYMLKVKPYYFMNDDSYTKMQNKGIEMMRKSVQIDPNSPLANAIAYEPNGFGAGSPYHNMCGTIWEMFTPEQWGISAVQRYFFRILRGYVYYPDLLEQQITFPNTYCG